MQDPGVWLVPYVALVFWSTAQLWMVQQVVYPLFARVGEAQYTDYHRCYSRRIPLPVIAPGFGSFLAPVMLYFAHPAVPEWMLLASIVTGAVGLGVTVLLEIPRHALLERRGKNDLVIRELIRFNWPRTLALSLQALLAIGMLRHAL